MAFFAANRHARRAERQERRANMEEARAVRDLARGNIGGFLRHEASASRHHNRAVREENMAANSAMGFGPGFRGRRHRHPRHYGGPGFGVAGGTAFAAGAAIGAATAGGYSSNQRVYGASDQVYSQAPASVVVVQQPQAVVVPQQQPQYEQMSVQCPAGAGPGSTIEIIANNQKMRVQVPQGISAGMNFIINVPKPSMPQVQAVPVTAPQPQIMAVTCPANAIPGQMITVNVNGQMRQVQIPQGVSAGMQFNISV